jgi:hypothetical protein
MNVYFLVEGITEKKIYPRWIARLMPQLERVATYAEVQQNNYYIFSGGGYPQILDTLLSDAIAEVNEVGKYDYLVVALDADEVTVDERQEEVRNKIAEKALKLEISCQLQVIIQSRCMETWFMGNQAVFPRNPTQNFRKFFQFYNVALDDPEKMPKPDWFIDSIGQFHKKYLKEMLREKNINYSEKIPNEVGEPYYLEQLEKRVENYAEHLKTLQIFLAFCKISSKQSNTL